MGRMIEADALMKAIYHRAFETDDDTMWQSGCWVRYRAVEQTVREQPTVDAVPVVRCKDCLMHGVCRFERGLGLNGYCSQAERRTNES